MVIFYQARLCVALGNDALSQATMTPLKEILVRKDAKASLKPLRLVSKEFRYSRQSRVAKGHHGVTRSFSGALLYGHSE